MSDLILVTGGAGTLGRAIAPVLLAAGHAVRLLDVRSIEGAPKGVDVVVGDVCEPADVRAAMAGVTAVIHAAAWHGRSGTLATWS
jgi:nucleoside-diphosphate-sugar epimerase